MKQVPEAEETSLCFHHVMVVWGDAFIDFFLRFALPCQLSPGNIAGLRHNRSSKYVIYTTLADIDRLRRSEAVRRLATYIDVEYFVVDPEDVHHLYGGDVHNVLAAFHRHAVVQAAAAGAYLIIWAPDALMSDGTLTEVEAQAMDGADTVLVTGLRTTMEEMLGWLETKPAESFALSSDDMVRQGIRHLHPMIASMEWGSERFNNRWPSQFLWRAGDGLMLVHSWHLHPLMTRPGSRSAHFATTVDGDYLQGIGHGAGRRHVCGDSRKICVLEVSRRDYGASLLSDLTPFDPSRFRQWAMSALQPIHCDFVRHPLVFRDDRATDEAVESLCIEAAGIIGPLADEAARYIPYLRPLRTLESLRGAGRVWIYGCGQAGRRLSARLREAGIAMTGFLDSRNRHDDLDGYPVLPIAEYAQCRQADDAVVVASQFVEEIEAVLRSLNISDALNASYLPDDGRGREGLALRIVRFDPGGSV
jgi:hypothetical protein